MLNQWGSRLSQNAIHQPEKENLDSDSLRNLLDIFWRSVS